MPILLIGHDVQDLRRSAFPNTYCLEGFADSNVDALVRGDLLHELRVHVE